jgi:hypothetical protein
VPSAFGCGAAGARAMWFFTVFALVSVVGKFLCYCLAIPRRAEPACAEAQRLRLTSVVSEAPAASRPLPFCYSAVV